MPSPPALDYAPPPTARRRWMRRLRRAWPVGLLLIVAGLAIFYGPGVRRRGQVIKLQEACMSAELPTDRPVYYEDAAAAQALVAARPKEYVLDRDGSAVRPDPQWAALAAEIAVAPWRDWQGWPPSTVFCHERVTPGGQRRLVVVEVFTLWNFVTVIEPGGWIGGGPRVLRREEIICDDAFYNALNAPGGLPGGTQLGAGIPDPSDPSRFTLPFVRGGIPGTWEYRLGNDDRVTMRLLDPEGFIARASAAKARAATQPVP